MKNPVSHSRARGEFGTESKSADNSPVTLVLNGDLPVLTASFSEKFVLPRCFPKSTTGLGVLLQELVRMSREGSFSNSLSRASSRGQRSYCLLCFWVFLTFNLI